MSVQLITPDGTERLSAVPVLIEDAESMSRRYAEHLRSPSRSIQLVCKRMADIIISLLGLILAAPMLLAIAIAIRLESRGPAILKQSRLGRFGRPFQIFKLRSMYTNSEMQLNSDGSTRVVRDDPRVTRIGATLRRIGLDEIPQLVNVLRGEMSLVGPRPDQEFHLAYYRGDDYQKLAMLPGITSLAQVEGRNALPWNQRMRLELQYVSEFSLLLDLRIVLKTVGVILNGVGLYSPAPPVE